MAKGGITVRLDNSLHRAAKLAAVHEGITLERLVSEAIVQRLKSSGHPTDITRPTQEVAL